MSNLKRNSQREHFVKRCEERVGSVLNRKEIIRQIQAGQLKFIEKQSNRISLFRYEHNNTVYRVVYDKSRKQLVTIFAKDKDNMESNGDVAENKIYEREPIPKKATKNEKRIETAKNALMQAVLMEFKVGKMFMQDNIIFVYKGEGVFSVNFPRQTGTIEIEFIEERRKG